LVLVFPVHPLPIPIPTRGCLVSATRNCLGRFFFHFQPPRTNRCSLYGDSSRSKSLSPTAMLYSLPPLLSLTFHLFLSFFFFVSVRSPPPQMLHYFALFSLLIESCHLPLPPFIVAIFWFSCVISPPVCIELDSYCVCSRNVVNGYPSVDF